MNPFKSLIKQTFIYGIATVLPRMLSFLMVWIHTGKNVLKSVADYGTVSLVYTYFVLFNVILAYGMETAFFRFFHKEKNKNNVIGTSTITLMISSFGFFILAFVLKEFIANLTNIKVAYINLVLWILLLDALVIIPFAWLRAKEKPLRYALLKMINVIINFSLNVFFLISLKNLVSTNTLFQNLYKTDFEINYIFIANLIASGVTLILMLPYYIKIQYTFNITLLKKMIHYAFPVLIAGIAFSINETFDRILLDKLLPVSIAKTQVGMYSACYKLAMFMTLFSTAYRLGIEPYFFSHSNSNNPQKNYAKILEYFVIFGAIILISVVVFADLLKKLFIRDEAFWEAMWIVPILLVAYLFLGIYHNLSVWYKITDRTIFGAYISVIGAISTLISNYLLIPKIGYKGSAIATLIAYTIMMFLSFYLGSKYYPIPYNIKKISMYLLVSITGSMVYFYNFREHFVIGIGTIIVFLILIFLLEKNEIKQQVKN